MITPLFRSVGPGSLLVLLIWLVQCTPASHPPVIQWHVCYQPSYAKGFVIRTNADSSIFNVLLLGTDGDTIKNWNIPAQHHSRTVCLSTTHIPMFQSIGAFDQVVGVGCADLIKNTEARAAIASGKIANISQGEEISKELLLGLQPDQFLIYSFGDKDYSFYSSMGIEVIPIAEYLENTPLARSEWVVLIGVLTGKFDQAISVFRALESRYTTLKNKTLDQPQPKIITGYYNSGHWYAPAGNSFVAQFLNDAGGNYIWKDSLANANIIVPFEALFAALEDCQYWGKLVETPQDPTRASFAGDVPQLTQLPSYANKKLFFCNTQRTDYFGDAVMQPDVVLRDLISIFHPELEPAHRPVYYQPLTDTLAIRP